MKNGLRRVGVCLVVIACSTGAAWAQTHDDSTLSAKQLAAKFQSQLTRGLVIAPSSATPGSGAAKTNAKSRSNNATYVAMNASQQVNIRIDFAFDSAAIGKGQLSKLTTLCKVIKASTIPKFKIIGHTDSTGSAAYNQNLSLLRAQEVKRHLVNDCGIKKNRLVALGVGERFPADPSNPKAAVNRRVEFQVGS